MQEVTLLSKTKNSKKRQAQAIYDHAIKANVVICTAQIPGRQAPVLIKKETVYNMLPGSVIIDLAASTGGNCELTKIGEKIVVKNVTIIGNANYASEMPVDSSRMFGNNVINFLTLLVDDEGKLNLNFEDELIKGTCVTYNGEIISDRLKLN